MARIEFPKGLEPDKVQPGVYLCFTEGEDIETVFIPIHDVLSVEPDPDDKINRVVIKYLSGDVAVQSIPLGPYFLIQIL